MKTAVSVPDDVYQKAERLARSAGKSRSEVYSTALREYVARHAPDEVTDALNRVVDVLGTDASPDTFMSESRPGGRSARRSGDLARRHLVGRAPGNKRLSATISTASDRRPG